MNVLWGVVVTLLSLLAWGAQVVSWLSPETAVRWKVMEAENDVEPAFWADVRGEAIWDGFTLWTMVLAGVLLSLDSGAWSYFGLVGGGMYLYFGGRGIMSRTAMRRQGLRIGAPENVRLGFLFSAIWAVMALITIIAAVIALAELS
ncbi:MAG: hypothetical protein HKN03_07610 [Acidimicrobiales bacterium]|nr:hypothetical protein [Acidimicrobiales bacterium]